jgi:hypothetical protein
MVAPLKIPPPPRLPLLGLELGRSKLGQEDDDEDDATMLWKGRKRSGSLLGGGFAAEDTEPFVFRADVSEEDSTFISKPNLKDPRLLRSDRPPALLALLLDEPTRVINEPHVSAPIERARQMAEPVQAAPSPGRQVSDESAVSPSVPADWEETPSPAIVIRTTVRPRASRAVWAAAVGLAAIATGLGVASDPERSAAFVDRVVAGGSALIAAVR